MAIIIMIGVYTNIRRSQAENVIQIEMEVTDRENLLAPQTVKVGATEIREGIYELNLPTAINGNIVTTYYTPEEEILIDAENNTSSIQLTETEIAEQKIQVETIYDKKEFVDEYNETKILL